MTLLSLSRKETLKGCRMRRFVPQVRKESAHLTAGLDTTLLNKILQLSILIVSFIIIVKKKQAIGTGLSSIVKRDEEKRL